METAMGVLGWTPRTFWEASPLEFRAAYRGKLRSLGVNPDDKKSDDRKLGRPTLTEEEMWECQRQVQTMEPYVRERSGVTDYSR